MSKDQAFFAAGLLGSLLQAAQEVQQERILKIETVRSPDDQKPKESSLPIPAVSSPAVSLYRSISPYLIEQLRASYQQTRAASVIGRDIATGELRSLSDTDRRTGLYILGISGMGKSWLFVNLILQDIKRGHGLVFLDPHGNAINDLLERAVSVLIFSDAKIQPA